jgi:hypothetical protein
VYTGNLNRQIEQYKEMIRIPHLTWSFKIFDQI